MFVSTPGPINNLIFFLSTIFFFIKKFLSSGFEKKINDALLAIILNIFKKIFLKKLVFITVLPNPVTPIKKKTFSINKHCYSNYNCWLGVKTMNCNRFKFHTQK